MRIAFLTCLFAYLLDVSFPTEVRGRTSKHQVRIGLACSYDGDPQCNAMLRDDVTTTSSELALRGGVVQHAWCSIVQRGTGSMVGEVVAVHDEASCMADKTCHLRPSLSTCARGK